ncbi:MAG: hypothetical protein A4E71_00194 [Smithella sp. PtaU1.Bin162]|nr:MAG: hypothetical protein A4E71_00194 [Smithella sp. PtaU1.Bin162]
MGSGTIVSIIVAVIGCVLAVFFYMNDSLDKRIDKAINHPEFIKKVAEQTKLPFIIFDEAGTFHSETSGASLLIEKIEPFKETDNNKRQRFAGFIVYPKKFFNSPPILQALNSKVVFALPKKINKFDWKFRIPEWEGTEWGGSYDEPPAKLYKLEILQ